MGAAIISLSLPTVVVDDEVLCEVFPLEGTIIFVIGDDFICKRQLEEAHLDSVSDASHISVRRTHDNFSAYANHEQHKRKSLVRTRKVI